MSILNDFSRVKYLRNITDRANDLLLKYWAEQKEKDVRHQIYSGDVPQVSHAEVAAVIDAIEEAK